MRHLFRDSYGCMCVLLLLFCLHTSTLADTHTVDYFQPNWKSLTKIAMPQWLADAKFGIFIHWGPVTVPAHYDEWYARWMYKDYHEAYTYHLETYGSHKEKGYIDFIPEFTGQHFDADRWVCFFKECGARFVVPVAEHHDHFAMWDSDLTVWDAKEKGPQKDVVGLIAQAARHQGLRFGVSDHRARGRTFYTYSDQFDTVDPDHADFYTPQFAVKPNPSQLQAWCDDWYARKIELIDKYQPSMLWFDYGWAEPMYEPYKRKLLAYYYNQGLQWGREVIVTYKGDHLPAGAGLLDIERGKLEKVARQLWQTDTSVARNTWCHTDAMELKPPRELIHDLIDIVSKNGVLLLNIGPRFDGVIPTDQKALLREMGQWLSMNGEAIYMTRPWQVAAEEGLRFTRKGPVIYVICLDGPPKKMVIKSLGRQQLGGLQIADVSMLGTDESLRWRSGENSLEIEYIGPKTNTYASVLKCTLQGRGFGYVDVAALHVRQGHSVTASGKVLNFTEKAFATPVTLFANGQRLGKPVHVTVAPMSEQWVHFDSIEETTTYGATLRVMPALETGVVRFALGAQKPISATQLMGFPAVNLSEGWRFQVGDNAIWSQVDVNDQNWQIPHVPGEWPIGREADTVGWYRCSFVVPDTWAGETLKIDLGIVNDACKIYLNGQLVKEHSNIDLEFHTAATSAQFAVPPDLICYGTSNQLAVRVYNKEGKAGMMGPPGAVYLVE